MNLTADRFRISDLKRKLKNNPDIHYKLELMEGWCKNIPTIIFSCGPSSNIDFGQLQKVQHNGHNISI